MKLPADAEFKAEHHLLVWHPHGIIDEHAVQGLITYIGEREASSAEPFNRFNDACQADGYDLNFQYIFHVALFRRLACAGRPPVKSAILVPSLARARYSKLIELLAQGSPLKVKVFDDRETAAKWLDVPLAVIIPPPRDQ